MTAIDQRPTTQAQPRTYDRPEARETKPSFMTTEFWAMLAGIVAIVVVYNVSADRSFDLASAATLATILAVGYFLSRGLAKSGTSDIKRDDQR